VKAIVLKYLSYNVIKYVIFYVASMVYDKVEIVNTSIPALIYGFLLLSIMPFIETMSLGIPTI